MRSVFAAVLVIFSVQQVHSQRSDLSFGLAPKYRANGYGLDFSTNYYHNTTDYYHLSVVTSFAKEQPDSTVEYAYEDYLLNLGYFTTILTWPNRGFSIFFGGGVSTGYEKINKGRPRVLSEVQIPESGFVYGVFASFELDFFLANSLSFIVPIEGMYHFNSKVDKSIILLGAGIRLYLK